jgi:predicted Zn-dependent protease
VTSTTVTPAQDVVDAALRASTADDCIVIVAERSETNLRWAANSLTTNGQMSSRAITVISIQAGANGTRAGVVTRPVASDDELTALVRDSERAAAQSEVADDAAPVVATARRDDDWHAAPAGTSVDVFGSFAPALGRAFRSAARRDELLFGFAEHVLTTTYLGTSTGVRRRWAQPTGRLETNAKSTDLTRSAWDGVASADFTDVDVEAVVAGLSRRLDWARTRLDVPPGRYETILPPSAVADLMINVYFESGARAAGRRQKRLQRPPRRRRHAHRPAAVRPSDPDVVRPGRGQRGMQPVRGHGGLLSGLFSVFDNGQDCHATDWIADGKLAELMRSQAWAAKTGKPPRPFVDNLLMDGAGTASLGDMIANTSGRCC